VEHTEHTPLPDAIIWICTTVHITSKSLMRYPAHWWNTSKTIVQCTHFSTNKHNY